MLGFQQKFQQISFLLAFATLFSLTTVSAQTCTTDLGWSSLATNPYTPRITNAALGEAADFNLFVFQGIDVWSSDVEGRTAVGGNVLGYNFSFGEAITDAGGANGLVYPNNCSRLDLVTDGTVTVNYNSYLGVKKGGAKYAAVVGNLQSQGGCQGGFGVQTGLINFNAAKTNLENKSTAWAALSADGTTTVQANNYIQFSGSNSGVNIFSVTAAELAACNNYYINVPSGSSVFINVSGTNVSLQNKGMRVGTPAAYTDLGAYTPTGAVADAVRSRVMFNFYEATVLQLNNIGWNGSILAPYASLYGYSGHINGNVIVNTIWAPPSGQPTIQINYRPFLGCLPALCDNITDAGSIGSDATGCAPFDPPLINSLAAPSGGSGALDIVWIYKNASTGWDFWLVSGANGLTYDPGVIAETTIFRRCSKRAGCNDFVGESNDITMTVGTAPSFTISNAHCTQGTNTTDPDDDRWSLNIDATAGNPSGTWFQVLYNGNVIESGTYGTTKVVDMGYIVDYSGSATLSIRDGATPSCTSSQTVNVPSGCSPAACTGFTFANKSVVCTGTSITICYDVQGAAGKYWSTSVKYTNDVTNHGYALDAGFGNQTGICHTITDPTQVADITAFSNNSGGNLLLWGMITQSNGTSISGTDCTIDQFIPFVCCTGTGAAITGNTSFCAGSATTLTATGGNTYTWSNGATSATISANTAGTYTVTATTGACTSTASITVTMNALPAVVASSATICLGQSANLVASGANTYLWNTGSTSPSIWLMPNVNASYTVTGTAANGCTATASGVVTVNALPSASITGAGNGCVQTATTLSANGGGTYVWSTGSTDVTLVVAPTATTTYTVTVTNAANCSATASVTLNAVPNVIAISAVSKLCIGNGTDLTGSAPNAVSYVWNTNETTATIHVQPSATTLYTVTATFANGCTASATVNLEVLNEIIVSSANPTNTTSCTTPNGTITVMANGSATTPLQYRLGSGIWQASNVFTGLAAGNYVVQVRYQGGYCTFFYGVVTVGATPPTINAVTAASTICAGDGTDLTASGGVSYTWNNNETTATINVAPTATTTYTVTATAANGCTGTAQVSVTVKEAIITSSLTANNLTSCTTNNGSILVNATGNSGTLQYRINGGAWQASNTFSNLAAGNYTVEVSYVGNYCAYAFAQATLTAPNAPVVIASSATICAMGSTNITANGASTYVWNTGVTTASIWTMPSATTTYTVTGTAANGCTATATSVVTVNPLPTAGITGSNAVCVGGSISLTANGGTSYVWSNGSNLANTSITAAGTYTVTVTNANGCTKTATKTITTSIAASATILTDGVVCGSGSVAMTAQGGTTYVWNTGATTASITTTSIGIYTVTATNTGGCTATATAEIQHDNLPIISITSATGSTNVCENTALNITAFSAQGIAYEWNTGETTTVINVTPTQTTTYTVTVTSPKGCTSTATITLTTKPCGTASIGDFVWFDGTETTSNSTQDTGEGGVAGVTVTLYDDNKNVLSVTVTNGRGYYSFDNLFAGNYNVGFTPLSGLAFVTQKLNTANGSDADENTGITPTFALANGEHRTDIDAGLKQIADLKGSLGNKVWYDDNKNGIQDGGEVGVANVTVNLFSTNATTQIGTTTTNAFGEYIFTNLDPTGYRVQFVLPANHVFTLQNIGEDQADSDADFATGFTAIVTLTKGENNTTVDAGMYDPTAGTASIGDFVWNDKDVDGIQDTDERGVAGIKVTLLAADGTSVLATTFTNENGYYLFSGLNPNDYMIAFTGLPNNFIFTSTTLNTANGSDANSIGRTPVFSLSDSEAKRDIDAGIIDNGIAPRDAASLGNFVWNDLDGNGRQDTSEPGVSGVLVTLYDGNNNYIAKTTTDRDGFYEFLGLSPTNYYVVFSDLPQGVIFTTPNNTPDDTRDSDADATTGRTQTINLAGGENNLTLDAGLVIKAVLGDFVWIDTNKDGAQTLGESGVANLSVELYVASNLTTPVQTTTTDDNGIYYFKVAPDTYIVKFAAKTGFSRTTAVGGGDNDSDANAATGLTTPITIAAGERNYTIDAGYYATPLPVKLVYFVGAAQNCTVNLKWETATELNNKTFVIQRSSDGLSFVTIATIDGAGTTNTPHFYEINDEKPSRKNYYRMLQIDFDGTTTTYNSANVVSTSGCFDDTTNGIDVLYPNPNKTNVASVKFYTEQADEQVNIEVFDALGRMMLTVPANIYTGANVVSFDISNLAAGNYMVRIKGNGWFTTAQKMIRM